MFCPCCFLKIAFYGDSPQWNIKSRYIFVHKTYLQKSFLGAKTEEMLFFNYKEPFNNSFSISFMALNTQIKKNPIV